MASGSKPAIFIVDDDEVVRDSLKTLLEIRGFSVVDFASAEAFLASSDRSAACLILDVHMPGMTGLELFKTMRDRGDLLPVILLTGRRDANVTAQAATLGALAMLDKPVSHGALFGAIQQAIDAKR